MKTLYLKFENQEEANKLLFDGEDLVYTNTDIIGSLYEPTGNMLLDQEGNEYPEVLPIDGWHVNVLLLDSEDGAPLEPYKVFPDQPKRVWS